MAFGFGDLVPYTQLPGAVAGQQASANAGAYDEGLSRDSGARSAADKAIADDLSAQLAIAKAPSALALSNLKDAQGINHLPPKASYQDLEDAHKEVMGSTDAKPDKVQAAKILALADERARAKMPKIDLNNPADWYAQQDPTSNQEMTLVRAQALLDGKLGMQQQNLDLRTRKEDDLQDYRSKHEDRMDNRVGMMTGVGPDGKPVARLPERKFSQSVLKDWDNSMEGRVSKVRTADGKRSPMWNDQAMGQKMVRTYKQLSGDYNAQLQFWNENKDDLSRYGEKPPEPPKKQPQRPSYVPGTRFGASAGWDGPQSPSPGQIGQDQMLADQEVPPPADAAGGRGPSLEGRGSGIQNPDGSFDMPEQDESSQYRQALGRDMRNAADAVTGSDLYKGVSASAKEAKNTLFGSGKPQPLINVPRRTTTDNDGKEVEVQKYSDGKWYPVGFKPGQDDERGPAGEQQKKIVTIGHKVHAIGDIVPINGMTMQVIPGKNGLGQYMRIK